MTTPKRIQQRRTKGWRKPPGAISVARPGKWGNPFKAGEIAPQAALKGTHLYGKGLTKIMSVRDNAEAVELYEWHLAARPEIRAEIRAELKGKTLMCWCREGSPCHGDVLLRIANDPATPELDKSHDQ